MNLLLIYIQWKKIDFQNFTIEYKTYFNVWSDPILSVKAHKLLYCFIF